ncbi:unnamed protein product [Phytophthora fragariaefolia]|uniref:Unnamed protein product n=1 Tax=Phytophthora fragariaefolia TaxID=1490495 RepID=A0A9W6Y7X7_9STRA|nr:unnamed protein product [Phytophthora fragariaefolia]
MDRTIVRTVEKNRFASAAAIAATVSAETGAKISESTIRSRIHDAGFHGRSARKKPFLSAVHRRKRMVYATKWKNMDPEDWENVLFSDEASVELNGTTGKISVWRRANEAFNKKCTVPTFKSSRKTLMVWSSISHKGVGTMHFCESSVSGAYYRSMLSDEIPLTRELLQLPTPTRFVQDGAPAHRAKATSAYLKELKLESMGHPPQSPDLNPIENLWGIMKAELHKTPATDLDDLREKLAMIWYKIPVGIVQKLIYSMPARLEAVRKEKGGCTRW